MITGECHKNLMKDFHKWSFPTSVMICIRRPDGWTLLSTHFICFWSTHCLLLSLALLSTHFIQYFSSSLAAPPLLPSTPALYCAAGGPPLSLFLPPSPRYNLHVSMPPEWGRRRWLAASGTSTYLRTLFLALRPPWMTVRLRRGRWGRFGSEVSLPSPSSCGSRSEPSSLFVDLDLSPPPSSSTFFNSALPPPTTSPLGLDLRGCGDG